MRLFSEMNSLLTFDIRLWKSSFSQFNSKLVIMLMPFQKFCKIVVIRKCQHRQLLVVIILIWNVVHNLTGLLLRLQHSLSNRPSADPTLPKLTYAAYFSFVVGSLPCVLAWPYNWGHGIMLGADYIHENIISGTCSWFAVVYFLNDISVLSIAKLTYCFELVADTKPTQMRNIRNVWCKIISSTGAGNRTRICFNIKTPPYQYIDPHVKDKTVSRPPYL